MSLDWTKRVLVSRMFVNIFTMQVCAEADATDEEILEVCNTENPAGTANGWSEVMRAVPEGSTFFNEDSLPVPCRDCEGRLHILVTC